MTLEREWLGAWDIHETEARHHANAVVGMHERRLEPPHEPFADQIGRQTELVRHTSRRHGKVDRSLAKLIFDDFQKRELRSIQIGTTERMRIQSHMYWTDGSAHRSFEHDVWRQGIARDPAIITSHPRAGPSLQFLEVPVRVGQ